MIADAEYLTTIYEKAPASLLNRAEVRAAAPARVGGAGEGEDTGAAFDAPSTADRDTGSVGGGRIY